MIELRVDGDATFDVNQAIDVFEQQRARFMRQLEGLSAEQWAAPSRCALWSVQDVMRHLCDVNERFDKGGAEPITFDGFDPRTTPNEWLRASDGEFADATLARFRDSTSSLLASVRQRVANGDRRRVPAPYGIVPWPVLFVHAYWDSWVHERDILVPLGHEHETDDDAVRLATAYAMFVAASVAAMFGSPMTATLSLSGIGGGTYDLTRDGDTVVLRVDPAPNADGPDAREVAEALTGRDQSVVTLLGADCKPLSIVANFFNTPV